MFGDHLLRSLALLDLEMPELAQRCRAAFGPRAVEIRVEHEQLRMWVHGDRWSFGPGPVATCVEVSTGHRALLRLLDGTDSLEEAVLTGRVHLRGDVQDLLAFHRALDIYLRGAVRSPSFPALLGSFRAAAAAPGPRDEQSRD